MLVLHYLQNKGHEGSSPNTGLYSPSPDIGGELCPGVRGRDRGREDREGWDSHHCHQHSTCLLFDPSFILIFLLTPVLICPSKATLIIVISINSCCFFIRPSKVRYCSLGCPWRKHSCASWAKYPNLISDTQSTQSLLLNMHFKKDLGFWSSFQVINSEQGFCIHSHCLGMLDDMNFSGCGYLWCKYRNMVVEYLRM